MTPETLLAIVLITSLAAYVVTGGADFGGGIWELFARGPRADEQHHALKDAIAPIWEANHVWLILVVVLLFVCFPKSFAIIMTALHIPLSFMLIGIVLRGAAFAFRSYSAGDRKLEVRSVRVFAMSSVLTPITLGISAGAVASGSIKVVDGVVQTNFVSEWLALFPLCVGLLLLSLCAWLAAVYMTWETRGNDELANDFRRRAIWSAIPLAVMAAVTALVAQTTDAHVGEWFVTASALGIVGAGALGLGVTLFALHRRSYGIARLVAAAVGVLLVAGWGVAQYPWLVPGVTTFQDAAPHDVLVPVLWALGLGSLLLGPAFVYLYRVFGK